MQRKGCKHLRIASILVILLGVISILAVQLLLGASEAETAAGLSESALKSILGGLLFIIQLAAFFQTGDRDQHYPACDPLLLFP